MENVKEMALVGYHHFNAKDNSKHFYVAQCLWNDVDEKNNNNRATLINVFVTEEQYKYIINNNLSVVKIAVNVNYATGKVYYSLVN